MINFLLSIVDICNIFIKTIRFSVINIPLENSSIRIIRMLGFLNPFYIINRKIPPGQRITSFLNLVNCFLPEAMLCQQKLLVF